MERFGLVVMLLFFAASGASAQMQRTFVSVDGSDANPCTALLPCRTMQRGHDAVDAGGEVVPQTNGGYGQLTITKALTIRSQVHASLSPLAGQTAIVVSVEFVSCPPCDPDFDSTVYLSGLSIAGADRAGANGLRVDNGKVVVEHCVFTHLPGTAVAQNGGGTLKLSRSTITGNGVALSGSVISFGDNIVSGNTSGESFSSVVVRQ